jgi:hypothetical protein
MLHLDSGCFLISQVNTRERCREGENISLKKSLFLKEKGKAKRKPKCDGKAASRFPSACTS